jgi:hypothetical protein
MSDIEDIFGEPISQYTDADAVNDGILVAISPRSNDRVTRTVFEFLKTSAPNGSEPPSNWPVEMMGWFRSEDGSDEKALALASGLIGRDARRARQVYEENIDGGIFKLHAVVNYGKLTELASGAGSDTSATHTALWLLPNEMGGITLMFPSDY